MALCWWIISMFCAGRRAVAAVKKARPFHIDAWVVLPDHLHAVWTLPPGDCDYSSRWRDIKKRFSMALPKTEYRSPTRKKRKERGIWQRRFWEHTIKPLRLLPPPGLLAFQIGKT